MKIRILTCAWGMALLASPLLAGIDQESNTDGFDPAAESFRINEARRQNAVARQLELKYRMLWAHGFDPANPPVAQPIGHESRQVGPNKWIYRPIYPEQVVPQAEQGPELLPAPAAPGPVNTGPMAPANRVPQALPKPSDAQQKDFIPPQKAAPSAQRSGPREL